MITNFNVTLVWTMQNAQSLRLVKMTEEQAWQRIEDIRFRMRPDVLFRVFISEDGDLYPNEYAWHGVGSNAKWEMIFQGMPSKNEPEVEPSAARSR